MTTPPPYDPSQLARRYRETPALVEASAEMLRQAENHLNALREAIAETHACIADTDRLLRQCRAARA